MKSSVSRYATSLGDEGEYEPGSHGRILKNLLGITSKRNMDREENEALIRTEEHFERVVTSDTIITVSLIQEIHRHFLAGIYSWGGKLRGVEISKEGYPFPPTIHLGESLKDFERDILRRLTPLRPQPSEDVPRAMAEVHVEFLAIHPFREGNGRVARIVADLMALQASKAPPHYGFTGRNSKAQKERYLNAVFAGYRKNYEPLTRFFEVALEMGMERWVKGLTGLTDFILKVGR